MEALLSNSREDGTRFVCFFGSDKWNYKKVHASDLKLAEISEERKAAKIKTKTDKTFRRPTDSDDDIPVENIPYMRNQVGSSLHVTEELRRVVEKEKSSAEGEVRLKTRFCEPD